MNNLDTPTEKEKKKAKDVLAYCSKADELKAIVKQPILNSIHDAIALALAEYRLELRDYVMTLKVMGEREKIAEAIESYGASHE